MPVTKIIFGFHTPRDSVTLELTAKVEDPAPDLTVIKRDVGEPRVVPFIAATGGWTVKLEQGDYLIKIEVAPGRAEFAGAVAVRVVDQPDATFVRLGPETADGTSPALAWTAGKTVGDPKDPWPPPGEISTLPAESRKWHAHTLNEARKDVLLPRSYDPD